MIYKTAKRQKPLLYFESELWNSLSYIYQAYVYTYVYNLLSIYDIPMANA
jgi:hypothetical protein